MKKNLLYFCFFLFIFFFSFNTVNKVYAATITASPVNLTTTSGETFSLSIFLDTEGEEINTLDLVIKFPPDKLQIASNQTGNSLITLWTSQPNFDNIKGVIRLQGGIPNGINTSKGMITTLTFRARGVGNAPIQIDSDSKAFLNDGMGTQARLTTGSAIIKVALPPPAGPIVTIIGDEEQEWRNNDSVSFSWANKDNIEAEGYSFTIDNKPNNIPDNIVDSSDNNANYNNLGDGEFYFHIKALNKNGWGGITHLPIKIDRTPPASFPINIVPSKRTSSTKPVIDVQTTDNLSGIRNYEMAIISLDKADEINQPFFFEFTSPNILPEMMPGSYEIIIRVYDNAGNFQEVKERLIIIQGALSLVANEGLVIRDFVTIPWWLIWSILGILIITLILIIYRLKHLNRVCEIDSGTLKPEIQAKLKELEEYKQKYQKAKNELAKIAIFILIITPIAFGNKIAFSETISPPQITNYTSKIAEDEIFYFSGKAEIANSEITIYFQDKLTGDLRTFTTTSDKNGGFIYQSPNLIKGGEYIFWAQVTNDETQSPPSPQYSLEVKKSVIDLGFSRFSYEFIFGLITIILIILIIVFVIYIRKLHKEYLKKLKKLKIEGQEAEDSIRNGFKEIRSHIHLELENIRRQVKSGTMTSEFADSEEERILQDLAIIEDKISKELEDVERVATS